MNKRIAAGVRSRWSAAEIRQRAELVNQLSWLIEDGTPLSQKALAFVLSYPAIASVIPGARSHAQLRTNLAVAGHRLTQAERHKLEVFWDTFTQRGANLLPW
jgi:aryl-alcohol dehydrogenase-like predicted oxidoreductase